MDGGFDPGSGLTLAACLTHASRTKEPARVIEWRTGEEDAETYRAAGDTPWKRGTRPHTLL